MTDEEKEIVEAACWLVSYRPVLHLDHTPDSAWHALMRLQTAVRKYNREPEPELTDEIGTGMVIQ